MNPETNATSPPSGPDQQLFIIEPKQGLHWSETSSLKIQIATSSRFVREMACTKNDDTNDTQEGL